MCEKFGGPRVIKGIRVGILIKRLITIGARKQTVTGEISQELILGKQTVAGEILQEFILVPFLFSLSYFFTN